MEPAEWLGSDTAERFPLHLISNQPTTKLHSQLDFAGISREAKVDGREVVTLASADAAARGIAEGDIVRLFNDRGETLASARISDDVRPGVILLPTGAWFDPLDAVGQAAAGKARQSQRADPRQGHLTAGPGADCAYHPGRCRKVRRPGARGDGLCIAGDRHAAIMSLNCRDSGEW